MVASMAPKRRTSRRKELVPLGEMFRRTETHVARINVEAHDHTISATLRVLGQSHRPVSGLDGLDVDSGVGDVGSPVERAKKMRRPRISMSSRESK